MNVLNSYNQLFSSELQSPPPEGKISSESKSKTLEKLNKKKLAYSAAAAVGITALCAAGIYLGKIKPKTTVEQITDITQDGIGKLLKENDKLTGKFSKTLEDGSKVVIEYSDGILQKSTKTAADGTQIFEKVYSKTVNGDLLVNNKNITEISNQAKNHQEDFISLIKKQDSSLDELQSFDRKNLSKKQIGELDGKIKAKQKIELEVKKPQEDFANLKNNPNGSLDELKNIDRNNLSKEQLAQLNKTSLVSKCEVKNGYYPFEIEYKNLVDDSFVSRVPYYYGNSVEVNKNTLDSFIALRKKYEYLLDDISNLSEKDKQSVESSIKDIEEVMNKLNKSISEHQTRYQESIDYHSYLKQLRKDYNNDQLMDIYSQVSQGQKKVEDKEYEALKTLYSQITKTPSENYSFSSILCHYSIGGAGYNSKLREDAAKKGIHCELADDFINMPETKGPMTLYRAIGRQGREDAGTSIIKNAEVGDIIVPDTATAYSAFNMRFASKFGDNILEEIRVPAGSKLSINDAGQWTEAMFPQEAKYKLISKGIDQNGVTNVVLEYIPEIPTKYIDSKQYAIGVRENIRENQEYLPKLLSEEEIKLNIKKNIEKMRQKGFKIR